MAISMQSRVLLIAHPPPRSRSRPSILAKFLRLRNEAGWLESWSGLVAHSAVQVTVSTRTYTRRRRGWGYTEWTVIAAHGNSGSPCGLFNPAPPSRRLGKRSIIWPSLFTPSGRGLGEGE